VVELVRARSPATAKSDFLVSIHQFDVPDLNLAASSPLYYITSLTSLFESVAMIVNQHQPVVEKYYGLGKMKNVVFRLLEEADRVTKILITSWEEDRSIQRKVRRPFVLALHILIERNLLKLSEVSNNPPVPLFSSNIRRQPTEDVPVDPREIDKVLSELAAMIGRWHLFKKFLSEALNVNFFWFLVILSILRFLCFP
jgi:conserved oligomeric Golgi complex subunit 4